MSNNIALPDSTTEALADKPEIYQRFFIKAAQCVFNEYIANQDLADVLIEAHDFDSENFPQFRYDLARVTKKDEGRLKDIHGCIEAAERGTWRHRALSVGHHEKVNDRRLEDGEKDTLLTEAENNDWSTAELQEAKVAFLEKHGRLGEKKERDNPIFELNEKIEHLSDRCESAAQLLAEAQPLTTGELHEAIEEWRLAE